VRSISARALAALFLLAGPGAATQALASFHFMVVEEVFPGTYTDPDAQYIMLRMTTSGQNFIAFHSVTVQNTSGGIVGSFTFPGNVDNGGFFGCNWPGCPAVIIGTPQAEALLDLPMDLTMMPILPLGGGRVCFDGNVDCVAWGNFSAPNTAPGPSQNGCDLNFGAPAAALQRGRALARTTFNCPAKENSSQFTLQFPRPANNPDAPVVLVDQDNDQLIQALDCSDFDATSLYVPLEIPSIDIDLSSNLSWQAQAAPAGSSLRHQIVTGGPAALQTSGGFSAAGCLTDNAPGLTFPDTRPAPATGEGYYYLVRGRNNCGGTYGRGSGSIFPEPREHLDSSPTRPCP